MTLYLFSFAVFRTIVLESFEIYKCHFDETASKMGFEDFTGSHASEFVVAVPNLLDLTLQRGVTSTARHNVNITCRGVTSTARHAARSHSFVYISTS